MVSVQMSQDPINKSKIRTKDEARERQKEKTMVVTNFAIRDIPTGCNPTPIPTEDSPFSWDVNSKTKKYDQTFAIEDLEEDIDHGLTEEYLKHMADVDDLKDATFIELTVDTSEQVVDNLGDLMPNLQQLKLNNSSLASFRDLGTSLQSLRILWLSRSGVTDLDGIGALCGLKELYLAFNDICDLTPLAMHDELQVLDLESNRLSDLNQIDQLGTCPNMVSLTLDSNPLCRLEGYRRLVVHHIPQLQLLDDKEVDADDYIEVTSDLLEKAAEMTPVLSAQTGDEKDTTEEYGMVQQGIKYAKVDMVSGRAQVRDQEAKKLARPGTADSRSRNARPGTSRDSAMVSSIMHQMEFGLDTDTGSELTHGTDVVFSGNCAKALRNHRCESQPTTARGANSRLSITETLDRAHELEQRGMGDIIAELKAWKLETAVAELASDPARKQNMKMVRPGTSAGVVRRELAWQEQSQSNFTTVAEDFAKARGSGMPPSGAGANGRPTVRPGTSACVRTGGEGFGTGKSIGIKDWEGEGPPQALSARSLGLSQRVKPRKRPGTSGSSNSRPGTAGSDKSDNSGYGGEPSSYPRSGRSSGSISTAGRNSRGVRGSRDFGDEVLPAEVASGAGAGYLPPKVPQAPTRAAPSKQVKEIAMPMPSATPRTRDEHVDERLVHRSKAVLDAASRAESDTESDVESDSEDERANMRRMAKSMASSFKQKKGGRQERPGRQGDEDDSDSDGEEVPFHPSGITNRRRSSLMRGSGCSDVSGSRCSSRGSSRSSGRQANFDLPFDLDEGLAAIDKWNAEVDAASGFHSVSVLHGQSIMNLHAAREKGSITVTTESNPKNKSMRTHGKFRESQGTGPSPKNAMGAGAPSRGGAGRPTMGGKSRSPVPQTSPTCASPSGSQESSSEEDVDSPASTRSNERVSPPKQQQRRQQRRQQQQEEEEEEEIQVYHRDRAPLPSGRRGSSEQQQPQLMEQFDQLRPESAAQRRLNSGRSEAELKLLQPGWKPELPSNYQPIVTPDVHDMLAMAGDDMPDIQRTTTPRNHVGGKSGAEKEKKKKSSTSSSTSSSISSSVSVSQDADTMAGGQVLGEANFQTDEELVDLLRQKPKNVPVMRTKESFRRFFAGMKKNRLKALLEESYDTLAGEERAKKVQKRLSLVADILS